MKCTRCDFENIPGRKECLKCGSILEVKDTIVDIHPPRMSTWKKPFREISRWFRQQKFTPEGISRLQIPPWLNFITSNWFIGSLLSIIPGLAHLINGRFKEIRLLFIAWLILISSGLFFYGSSIGFLLIGLAMGTHAWIALQYGIFKLLSHPTEKIVGVLFAMLLLALVYRAVPKVVLPNLTGAHTPLAIPHYNIEEGDFLLARRLDKQESQISRGALVLFSPTAIGGGGRVRVLRTRNITVGEIIGFSGELVKTKSNAFMVNGQQLDTERFPVPRWLRNREISINIGNDSYFVSSEYDIHIRSRRTLTNDDICNVCAVRATDIKAQVFMHWLPIGRRGFIR